MTIGDNAVKKALTKKIVLASTLIAIAAGLSACGRKGDLEAPGASLNHQPIQAILA